MTDPIYNDRQTHLSAADIEAMPPDVQERFLTAVSEVPFIKYMVSPLRPRAKDLPRKDGRIVVDVTRPHILEDMDYFRPAAIHFEKHGCYTKLRPNGNPNSEYMKWMRTEMDRIWNGMVRESDGEWIPGILYFYWNYARIMFSEIIEGTKKANRVESFPEPWDSTYLWAHYIHQAMYGGLYNEWLGGQHFGVVAKRGVGKSFFFASLLCRAFMCGENATVREKVKSFLFAYDKQYLNKDGTLNKFLDMYEFLAKNTQFPHLLLKTQDSTMHWVMGYLSKDKREMGVLNEVTGLSVKDDPDKVRGKRGVYTLFEEFGKFPGFQQTFDTARYNAEEGDYAFGSMGCVGTGGTRGADFSGALEMIYHPSGFQMYGVPNVFDIAKGKPGNSIMFLGAYMNRKGCYDKDGNSDIVKAMVQVMMRHHKIKVSTTDLNSVTQAKAEEPITLQDCIMRVGGNIYPVADLTSRITELELDPHAFDDIHVGRLDIVGGKVEFRHTDDTPIRKFPHESNKLEGALEIYAMPETSKTSGLVMQGRYLLGADVFDNDVAESESLGSVLVLDSFTDRIVAEYTGRPQYADDFYEICRRLCLFYNGRLCYENNFKGLYAYFSRWHSLHLLEPTLQFLRDKELSKGELFGNTSYGVRATTPVKSYARGLIKEWLKKPVKKVTVVDGEEMEEEIPNMMTVRNIALLQELSKYDLDNNFDRHDALAVLMLYREDVYRLNEGDPSRRQEKPKNAWLDDSYFRTYEEVLERKGLA